MTATQEHTAEIRRRLGSIAVALRAKDLDALREVYAADVVSFDVEPPLQHVGIDAKLRNWVRVFDTFATVDYELRDLTLTVDDRVAFGHAFGRLSGTLADGTAVPGMWVRGTFGLRRDGDRWVIAHDQVSVPLDVRTGAGITDLEP
ncbi:YybH family protein [Isoptericola sp. NPDC057559]|jgi:ketosteroid isomerase-like protein|uniref:YybH family protein n=1 Tax=Isoptericola sp. NPDC057559 TaxID=3346168 RepID=UPI003680B8EE